jgi:hypothetical protein
MQILNQDSLVFFTTQKTAFSVLRDDADDDDGTSIFYSSPTQMAIQVSRLFLLYMIVFLIPSHHSLVLPDLDLA